jgi:ubiquinone/menaquinone biosynthesis C-methylase UbiE
MSMSVREQLNKIYSLARKKIVPNLRYSQYLYQDVLESKIDVKLIWLDIGCGHHLLPPWCLKQEKQLIGKAQNVIGIDYDFPSLTQHKTISLKVQALADALPFRDGHFDIVTANMVVEHLNNPNVQFAEVKRVLKPNGIFIFHTVNETGYFAVMRKIVPNALVKKVARVLDGRESGDVFEIHYKANSEKKIRLLAQETGFEVEKIKLISSDAVFALIPPLAIIELFWIRLLMHKSLQKLRTNIIVVLKKKANEW